MFFCVLMSQSVASPFMFDTMLRSGEPPHIGQSPVPGSDAERRTAAAVATRMPPNAMQRRRDAKNVLFLKKEFLCTSAALRRRGHVLVMLFIWCEFQVVDVRP